MNVKHIRNLCAIAICGLAFFGAGPADAFASSDAASTKTGKSVRSSTTLEPPTPTASKGTYATYVRITWKKVSGASGYIIKRGTSSSYSKAAQLMKVSGASTVSLNDSSAVSGKTYYYWVCPYDTSRGVYWYNTGRYASGYRGATESLALSSTSVKAGTTIYIYYKKNGSFAMPSSLKYNAGSSCAKVYKYPSLRNNACGYINTLKAGSVTVYADSVSAKATITAAKKYTYTIQSATSVNVGKAISMQCYRSDGTLVDANWKVTSGGSCVSIAVSTYLGHAITCTGRSAGKATITATCNGVSCSKTITVTGSPLPNPEPGSYISGPSSVKYLSSKKYYLYVGGSKVTSSSVAWSRSGQATMQDKGSYGLLKATNRPVSTNKVTVYAKYNGKTYSKTVTIYK